MLNAKKVLKLSITWKKKIFVRSSLSILESLEKAKKPSHATVPTVLFHADRVYIAKFALFYTCLSRLLYC